MFTKGKSGNPSGRPKLPEDILKSISSGREDICRALFEIENLTISEVKSLKQDELSLLKRVILKAFIDNDHAAIKIYQDRVYGKAKETMELDHNINTPVKIVIEGVSPENTDPD